MSKYTLCEYTQEEYKSELMRDLEEKGLFKSVVERLNEINDITSTLGYVSHRLVQELMREVLDLIKLKEKEK